MPVLDISRDELGPLRCRATLSYLLTVMLWPTNAAKRDWAHKAILATRIDDAISEPGAADRLSLTHDGWVDIVHFMRSAPSLRDVQEECAKPFCHGLAAGFVLSGVLHRREIGAPDAQLGAVMDSVVESVLPPDARDFKFALSRSTLNNTVWPEYCGVAHLWASHIWRGISAGDWTFPARLDRLSDFLTVAEWFRREGEAWRPKGGARPVLDPLDTWRLPEGIDPSKAV
jgi:hypothetical protein